MSRLSGRRADQYPKSAFGMKKNREIEENVDIILHWRISSLLLIHECY